MTKIDSMAGAARVWRDQPHQHTRLRGDQGNWITRPPTPRFKTLSSARLVHVLRKGAG